MPAPQLHREPTALELANQIARGELSAGEATEAAIDRIERLDGAINAVVVRDFDRARDQAKAADARRAKGEARPPNGRPATLKEKIKLSGP